jgi:hypothetical protein
MFVSFNNVFNKKPQAETEVPKAVLEYMNEQLPQGLKYISSSDGRCTIINDVEELTFGGMIFNPTEEQKRILGENYTYEDILSYSYNAQKEIPMKLEKDGFIILNGREVAIDKLSYNPLLSVKYLNSNLFLCPQKFPAPFSLIVGDGKYSRNLTITRIPNESVHVAMFQSNQEEPLMIKYAIDEKKQKMNISITYNLKYAKTIRDVVESTMIYNAYLSGKAYLNNYPLNNIIHNSTNKQFNFKTALFWEKVLKIEEFLNVQFVFPVERISNEDFLVVEGLYQNLINNEPICNTEKITSLDGDWNNKINESIGKPILIQFISEVEFELFKIKTSLPAIHFIYNAKIKDIQRKDGNTRLILEDESEEKKEYFSSMVFKNKEKMEEYKSLNSNKITSIFQNAKTVRELINENNTVFEDNSKQKKQ